MRKWGGKRGCTPCLSILLSLALLWLPAFALATEYQDGVYRDLAEGYNGDVIVTVTVRGGKITELTAQNRSGEESEYFRQAEQGVGAAVVERQGVAGVEAVSGATGTSESILAALNGIFEQAAASGGNGAGAAGSGSTGSGNTSSAGDGAGVNNAGAVSDGSTAADGGSASARPAMTPRPTLDPAQAEVFSGLGSVPNFRVGPGKDEKGVQVYSFNVTMASVVFDREGKILDARVDIYEISTPNYDGASMPHFSGWPGKEGYNVTDAGTGKVTGVSEQTEESLTREISAWVTKRERGDTYGMNPQNEWHRQMDAYEQWMLGKTVMELREWFSRHTTSAGRPIKQDSGSEDDQKLLASLSEGERGDLADLTSMATMSLSDSHGLILEAIEKAYENRTPVEGVSLGR